MVVSHESVHTENTRKSNYFSQWIVKITTYDKISFFDVELCGLQFICEIIFPLSINFQLFQSTLGPQQAKMDVAIKSGKVLIDRGEVDDAVIVEEKIAELKERWDGLCALSVDRYDERKLN